MILDAAKRLDKLGVPAWQVGIQFFQVGKEPQAAQALRELDGEECQREGHCGYIAVEWRKGGRGTRQAKYP